MSFKFELGLHDDDDDDDVVEDEADSSGMGIDQREFPWPCTGVGHNPYTKKDPCLLIPALSCFHLDPNSTQPREEVITEKWSSDHERGGRLADSYPIGR